MLGTQGTATINSKLMEQFPQPPVESHVDTPEPETYDKVAGPLAARVTIGTSDSASLHTQDERKLGKIPVRVKRREIWSFSKEGRSGTQKPPRHRIQINVQTLYSGFISLLALILTGIRTNGVGGCVTSSYP